uniref:Uncharacterized protein n=1 Tax=Lactuca sativa TaxID=4236 RepID=A0A9R1XB80_LACSA|nr:hypothetical protein LSAT_V11C500255430 [Lactuca sativa]
MLAYWEFHFFIACYTWSIVGGLLHAPLTLRIIEKFNISTRCNSYFMFDVVHDACQLRHEEHNETSTHVVLGEDIKAIITAGEV